MGAVGVFWDYENCQYTAGRTGFDIARNIEEQARCHGLVRTFNAYLDVQQCATPATLRSELQSSGVTLVDCPHNGQKNVVDLMLLTDMLVFALSEPAPSTVVLVSGDRDFAYTASILRQRGHTVVLVCHARPGPHRSLAAQVSECVDWNQTILKMDEEDKAILPAKKKLATAPSKSVTQVIPGEVATPEEAPEEAAPKESSPITGERSDAASGSPEADVNSVHPEYSSPVPTRGRSPAPAPYPLPSSIATQSSPTAKVALFQPLIRVLQAHLRSNDPFPRRSLVGSELITSHPRVYAQANVAGFKEYSAAAEAAGVVVLGGLHAAAWIALTVEYGGIADRKEGSGYSNARPARRMPDHRPPSPPGYPPSPSGYYSSAPSSPSPNHRPLSPYSPVSTSDYRSPSPYRSRAYASSYYTRPQSPFHSPPTSPQRDRTYRAYQPAAAVEPWKQVRERYRASHPAPTITPPFRTLVNVLDDLRKSGSDRPLRSSVGLRLGREVYKSAGVNTFAEYVNLAVGAGLVRTGGKDGGAWITLDWAVQV